MFSRELSKHFHSPSSFLNSPFSFACLLPPLNISASGWNCCGFATSVQKCTCRKSVVCSLEYRRGGMILLNGSNMSPAKNAQHRKHISNLSCYENGKQGMGGRSAAEGCPVSLHPSAAIENSADVDEQARSEPCVFFHLDSLLFMSKVTLRPGLNAACSHSGFFSLSCPQLDNPVVHQCVSLWQNGFSTRSQLLHRERNTRAITFNSEMPLNAAARRVAHSTFL